MSYFPRPGWLPRRRHVGMPGSNLLGAGALLLSACVESMGGSPAFVQGSAPVVTTPSGPALLVSPSPLQCVIEVSVGGRVRFLDLCYDYTDTVVTTHPSPDGQRIAFTRAGLGVTGRTGGGQILMYDANAGTVAVFYDPGRRPAADGGPTEWVSVVAWSHDGRYLVATEFDACDPALPPQSRRFTSQLLIFDVGRASKSRFRGTVGELEKDCASDPR